MNELHVTAGDIWLFLLREGGWWRPSEVAKALRVPRNIGARLVYMRKCGSLAKHPLGLVRYGVTAECKVPNGVTLKRVQEAIAT